MLRFAYPRSSEGPSPETRRRRSGEWRLAAAARNRRPREARDPARQAQRPGCEELAALIRRQCRRRKRGPRPKIATVERREASASRWTRAAPRQAWTVARHERDNRRLAPFGAPLAPHGADGKEESKTRTQKRAAGTKKTALFDMLNRNTAATRLVPAERAKRRAESSTPSIASVLPTRRHRIAMERAAPAGAWHSSSFRRLAVNEVEKRPQRIRAGLRGRHLRFCSSLPTSHEAQAQGQRRNSALSARDV